MEIDSEPSLQQQIKDTQKLVTDIMGSSQNTKHPFLAKAVMFLNQLKDLMNERELSDYVSKTLLTIFFRTP
jgi:hypothetical protein